VNYTMRPLGPWTEPVTQNRRGAHVFKASWADTLDLLSRELEHLGADEVILQVDLLEHQLRRDGMPRADAKMGPFPGVRISFQSKHGPLTYATDAHENSYYNPRCLAGWQANVRAIALALEALRAVDRYGVSGRGQQYTGWTAIEATATVSDVAAAALLLDPNEPGRLIGAPTAVITGAFTAAVRRHHPDFGGDGNADMAAVVSKLRNARDLLLTGTKQ